MPIAPKELKPWIIFAKPAFHDFINLQNFHIKGNRSSLSLFHPFSSKCNNSYTITITTNILCAGHEHGGEDSCQNDSGGPLVCQTNGRWTLYGVVNSGEGCGAPHKYGLYARVTRFLRYVDSLPPIRNNLGSPSIFSHQAWISSLKYNKQFNEACKLEIT